GRARPCGPRLLVDGVAAARRRGPPPGMAGERPGAARRVGDPGLDRHAEMGAILRHGIEYPPFAAEEMRRAGQVDDESIRRLLAHARAELSRPAAERGEEACLGMAVPEPGEKPRAHGERVAQGLTEVEPRLLRAFAERGEDLPVRRLADDGEGGGRPEPAHLAQDPFRAKAGKPE